MQKVLPVLGFFIFICYAITQLYIGFLGIEYEFGTLIASLSIGIAFGFRITLPLTIGAFWGAMHLWGWHWFLSLLFAAPGLLLQIPAIFLIISSAITGFLKKDKSKPKVGDNIS